MGLLLLLLALLAVACQDDMGMSRSSSTAEETKPGGIRVSIDNSRPFSVTRAKLVDSPGISMDVEWEGGDATGVYSTKGDNLQYTLAADDIESNNIGTFRNEAGTPEGEFYAYFPYEITAGGTPEGGLVLTMPATQQLNLDGAKPMPDDMASAMVGKGNAGNVTLHSVHAILKVGYVAMDSVDVMKYITFRDLNGKPVSGRYTVRLDDNGFPEATFPASGSEADDIITLECDSNYSTVTASDLRTFYLVVPARDYPQGFELTFYLKSGKSESKTIGKLAGKKLERTMVYPVGEVSIIREGSYVMEFNGEGFLMDEDQMALVENIWPIDYQQYYTPDYSAYSSDLSDMSKLVQSGPMKFAMVVDKRLDIHEDMTIVINRVSEALPYGLIAKVTAVDKQGDNQLYVELQRYAHIEGAFKKLQMGATRYNADGTPLDEQGINLGIDEQNLAAATEDPNAAENLVPYDSLDAVTDSIPEYLYDDVPVAPEDSLGETYEDEEASSLLVSRSFPRHRSPPHLQAQQQYLHPRPQELPAQGAERGKGQLLQQRQPHRGRRGLLRNLHQHRCAGHETQPPVPAPHPQPRRGSCGSVQLVLFQGRHHQGCKNQSRQVVGPRTPLLLAHRRGTLGVRTGVRQQRRCLLQCQDDT